MLGPCKACRVFCRTRHTYKHSIFPAWCLQLSKTKQNANTVLVRLAFPITAHQNANQKPMGSAPAYQVRYTLPPQTIYQTLLSIFQGSGSETRLEEAQQKKCITAKIMGTRSLVLTLNVGLAMMQ